jgi:hypothetical protein
MTGPIVLARLTPNVRFLVLAASLIKEESRKGPRVVQLEGEYWASQMLQTARNDVRRVYHETWIVDVIMGRS